MSPAAAPEEPSPTAPPGLLVRIRARFRAWAQSRFAVPLMCFLSFTDACVSPIIPEVVLVPLVLARPERRWHYAFLVSLASVLGGMLGYGLGMFLWDAGVDRFFYDHVPGFSPALFQEVSAAFGEQTFLVVWLAGFTPLPYKVFTVAAGVCHGHVDFGIFVLASVLSRAPRFYLTVWILHRFGPPVLAFLLRRLGVITAVCVVLALGWWLWKRAG